MSYQFKSRGMNPQQIMAQRKQCRCPLDSRKVVDNKPWHRYCSLCGKDFIQEKEPENYLGKVGK